MSDSAAPTPTKLIVLLAFDRSEDGDLLPAFEPREMRDEGTAIRTAKEMARRHVGVIACPVRPTCCWANSARPWCCIRTGTCRTSIRSGLAP